MEVPAATCRTPDRPCILNDKLKNAASWSGSRLSGCAQTWLSTTDQSSHKNTRRVEAMKFPRLSLTTFMVNENEPAITIWGAVSKGILTEKPTFNPISFGKRDFTGWFLFEETTLSWWISVAALKKWKMESNEGSFLIQRWKTFKLIIICCWDWTSQTFLASMW